MKEERRKERNLELNLKALIKSSKEKFYENRAIILGAEYVNKRDCFYGDFSKIGFGETQGKGRYFSKVYKDTLENKYFSSFEEYKNYLKETEGDFECKVPGLVMETNLGEKFYVHDYINKDFMLKIGMCLFLGIKKIHWFNNYFDLSQYEKEYIINHNMDDIFICYEDKGIRYSRIEYAIAYSVLDDFLESLGIDSRELTVSQAKRLMLAYKIKEMGCDIIPNEITIWAKLIEDCLDGGILKQASTVATIYCNSLDKNEDFNKIFSLDHSIERIKYCIDNISDIDIPIFISEINTLYDDVYYKVEYDETKNIFDYCGKYNFAINDQIRESMIKYHRFCPKDNRIIAAIRMAIDNNGIDIETAVKRFNNKKYTMAKEKLDSILLAVKCVTLDRMYALNMDYNIAKEVLKLPVSMESLCLWLYRHKDTNEQKLTKILEYKDVLINNTEFNEFSTLSFVMNIINSIIANKEMILVEKEYNFSRESLKSNIKSTNVSVLGQKAFVLDSKDPRQVMLGYDTNCCQHLGGAGESAMMYGLLAPNAGFWAIEEKDKIIAQAEIWLGYLDNKEVLVFDNIELANDRDFNIVRGTLEKWLENSPYNNIIMGTGYNVMSHGYESVEGDLVQPMCELVPDPYTDAKKTVWLKKGGEVQYV